MPNGARCPLSVDVARRITQHVQVDPTTLVALAFLDRRRRVPQGAGGAPSGPGSGSNSSSGPAPAARSIGCDVGKFAVVARDPQPL